MRRVADIKDEEKLRIFHGILLGNLTNAYESDFTETFLDLVSRLDHIQIKVLKLYRESGRSGSMDIPEGAAVVVSSITSRSFKREILEIIKDNNPSLSTIESEGKYEFYICDLINKALVIDTKTVELL
ncbi:hypothetical protein GC102_35475 [Paenibacillus sp. LMG 31460]|uniref:Uncharacterized protein n=1 Tax=Paenibacillus germinis TaxID=2654979 RepID=A0ABX1ZDN1_9BACL|nr:hypothetical protein [Paenibacillus germinis]NOU90989.1 hypothetical protein [Paenibacillus germinis]